MELVNKKLNNFKIDKSPGLDDIHPGILKELGNETSEFFIYLFKLPYKTGSILNDWSSSIVTALFKKGSRSVVNNYRSISLTCIICKVF